MNKQRLVKEITNRIDGATQKDVALILDTFQEVVKDVVATGEDIKLTGFLTFSKKHTDAKSGVSRIGGKETPWKKDACDVISVKLSKAYREI